MIVAWNVKGLNKIGKVREISSHLSNLNPNIAILIETRVKSRKVDQIRNKLKLCGQL